MSASIDFFSDLDESPDFFADIEEFSPKASTSNQSDSEVDFFEEIEPQKTLFQKFKPEEKTSKELKAMTAAEKAQYAKDLATFRELQQSRGFTKGVAKGLTLGLSEKIPGLKPDEEDLMVGLGDIVGSYLPITGLYNLMGKPLVQLAAKSPVAKRGLMSLARITGFGATGAAYKAGKDIIQGEVPTAEELGKEAAIWGAIDAGLQTLGKGLEFSTAIRSIAEKEGVPAKDVLSRLWRSTKNFLKKKFIPAEEIGEAEVEALMQGAKKAEQAGLPKETEIEVKPEAVKQAVAAEKSLPAEKPAIESQQLFNQIQNVAAVSDEPIIKAQAQWVVDEMAKEGNDLSKLQSVVERMPQILAEREGNFIPQEAGTISEEVSKPEEALADKVLPPLPGTGRKAPVVGKKQAVARSKILDHFRNAFNDPIRLGKLGKRKALGIHKLWPRVTRLLKDNDVETAAHEIGHNLHTTLYGGNAATPKEQIDNIKKALKPYTDELKPLGRYTPHDLEGFAEFTRLYVTNPDIAKQYAQNFYNKFDADLDAQYPELKNALLEARDYYDSYLQGTPQSRIRAQTSYGEDKGKLAQLVESVKDNLNLDKLKTEFLDDVFPAKRLVADAFGIPLSEVENLKDERNLYRALRVLKGAVGKGDVFVLHETFDAKTLNKTGGSLKDILDRLPNEEAYREFNDYLIARRSIEKTAQNIETGIEIGDALAVVQDLKPKYEKLALQLDKYNSALLKYAVDSGLLSQEQYQAIKQNNLMYTPFQRVMEREKGSAATGAGKLQAGRPIKRMKGSTRDIVAPIESILKNTYSHHPQLRKEPSGPKIGQIGGDERHWGSC